MASHVAAGLVVVLAGCVRTPSVDGVAGTAPVPGRPWTPPPSARPAAISPAGAAPLAIPPDLETRIQRLTLPDIVDLALRNNPETRVSWANARAAAAAYGSQKGAYYPTVDGDVTATRQKSIGRFAVQQTTFVPSVSLSFLVLDFGGRGGAVAQARQALLAADWTHNATIQSVVLDVESAYFNYMAMKGLLAAQQTTVKEAEANLAATQDRHRVGLATVADELQARTALSQAQLDLETDEGNVQTTRGALAVALGLPANIPYDVQPPASFPVAAIADSVDTLITQALAARPDLAAAQAQFEAAHARIRQTRAARLPSLTLNGTGGRTYFSGPVNGVTINPGNSYSISLGLRIPLFAGFSRLYDQRQAEAEAEAAAAQVDVLRQQVVFQVFSSYYALETATRRVRTADDLLASAQESEDVALGRYKAGVGSVLDLLTAQAALASARAQQSQARWVWATSLSQLAHDTGILDIRGGSSLRLAPDSTDKGPPR